MRLTRSAALFALMALAIAASATGCTFAATRAHNTEIVVAADLELTGTGADVGVAYQRALTLKVDQINESGLLGGRTLRLDIKDNRSDPSQSLRNIGAFANDSSVAAIVMGVCSACAVGAATVVNERRIPTIALAPANDVANPVAERRYVFKIAPNAADDAALLTTELSRAGRTRVALLYTNDGYGQEGLNLMRSALAKTRATLVAAEPVKPTDTDLSQPVRALVDKKPDAIVVWTLANQATFATQAASLAGFGGELFFDAGAAGDLFLAGQSGLADGSTLVFTQTMVIDDVIATSPAKAARKKWFRDYVAQNGSYHGFSSFAADAVQMIADAIAQSTDGVDRERIRAVLETSQFDGLSGPIRITPENHSGLMPQALAALVARSGRWRLAG